MPLMATRPAKYGIEEAKMYHQQRSGVRNSKNIEASDQNKDRQKTCANQS